MSIVQLLNINELNNSYDNTIDFENVEAQNAYFANKVYTSIELPTDDDYVYIRETKTIEVDINKQKLQGVNYLRFNNGNKWWYAFITQKTYINEFVTSITFEIDVLQTFMFDYEILESYISREHQDRFNSDGTPIFNLKDEQLDLGECTLKVDETTIYKHDGPDGVRVSALLLICDDTIIVNEDGSTENTYGQNNSPTSDLPDPLRYYLLPIVNTPTTIVYDKSGNKFITAKTFVNLLTSQLQQYTSGVNFKQAERYSHIIQMNILPYIPFDYELSYDGSKYTLTSDVLTITDVIRYTPTGSVDITARKIFTLQSETLDKLLNTFDFASKCNLQKPTTYTELASRTSEPKLCTYPYNCFTLDDDQTQPLMIKPQYLTWGVNDISLYQSVGVNPITKYSVKGYLGDNTGSNYALINNNINNINLVSNKLADYLAQNSASATTGLAVNTGVSLLTGIGGALASASLGNAIGSTCAIAGGIQGVKNTFMNVVNENFKRQDLSNGPPNFKDKGNNVYAYWQQYAKNTGLKIKQYQVQEPYLNFAFNFMQHFGYKCNDFKVPNLKTRYYYNYIQAHDLNIKSQIDNEYIDTIKSIFAKGVTFWHYRDASTFKGINVYDYENIEMNLLES